MQTCHERIGAKWLFTHRALVYIALVCRPKIVDPWYEDQGFRQHNFFPCDLVQG